MSFSACYGTKPLSCVRKNRVTESYLEGNSSWIVINRRIAFPLLILLGLFIYDLFDDAVQRWYCTSTSSITIEIYIEKFVEGSGRGLI
jgi:hypothetical protein